MSQIADKKNIVIVEDDMLTLQFMSELINLWGYEAIPFLSLDSGIIGFNDLKIPPSLLIVDYHLEGQTTGVDAVNKFRSLSGISQLPAIISTGDISFNPAKFGLQFVQVMRKPIRPEVLKTKIASILSV